jgi:hypothetical protein
MKRCVQNVEESVPCEKLGKFLVRQDRGVDGLTTLHSTKT